MDDRPLLSPSFLERVFTFTTVLIVGLFLFTNLAAAQTPDPTPVANTEEATESPPIDPIVGEVTEVPALEPVVIEEPPADPTEAPPAVEPTEVPPAAETPEEAASEAPEEPAVPESTEISIITTDEPVAPTTPPEATSEPAPSETPVPSETATISSGGGEETTIRVTVKLGDNFGPPLANVCATLMQTTTNFWLASGCTDANGVLLLQPWIPYDQPGFGEVRFDTPSGYQPIDSIGVTILPNAINDYLRFAQPAAPVARSFFAVQRADSSPLGGACWTFYSQLNTDVGSLILGPLCDDDLDGALVVPDFPAGAFCYGVTAPAGYVLLGGTPICREFPPGETDVTRAFIPGAVGEDPGPGLLDVRTVSEWGLPIPDVCVALSRQIDGGQYADVATGCTDANGEARFQGLIEGTYVVSSSSVPKDFEGFDATVNVSAAGELLTITVPSHARTGSVSITVYAFAGPDTVGGACANFTTIEEGVPGDTVVVGPNCDTDGDGEIVFSAVPTGDFCFVVTPPAGWYRADGQYSTCYTVGTSAVTWRIGLQPVPTPTPTPTPRATKTPSPTRTPSPTPTRTPTAAPDEPKGNLAVQNCQYSEYRNTPPDLYYNLCSPVAAGVRFAVVQNGADVATVVTAADGTLTVVLPRRAAYQLRYLDGNGPEFAPGPGELARIRYGAGDTFTFTRSTPITMLTMTVRTKLTMYGSADELLGGVCYRIIAKADGAELLPPACDTDGDGITIIGQLPVASHAGGLGGEYLAEMTAAPPGYSIQVQRRPGVVMLAAPDVWESLFYFERVSVRVKTVDPDGNVVTGFGYTFAESVGGHGTIFWDFEDLSGNDGYTPGFRAVPNQFIEIRADRPRAGWKTDLYSQSVTVLASGEIVVTFVARPYGSDEPDRANVRIVFEQVGDGDASRIFWLACASLSPASGIPNGELCADDPDHALLFRNVPLGSYSVLATLDYTGGPRCLLPSSIPQVVIGSGQLGTTVELRIGITCPVVEPPGSCFALRENTDSERIINVYYGEVTDAPNGNVIGSAFQVSEALPDALVRELRTTNPFPDVLTQERLAPWTIVGLESPIWALQPDWDGDAGGALRAEFRVISPDAVPGNAVLQGSAVVYAGFQSLIYFLGGPNDPLRAAFPECKPTENFLIVATSYVATLNVYRQDATIPAPEVTPEPTATLYPSPEAVCETSADRNVTIAFGTVTDPRTGRTMYSGLESSVHLPKAIADAILAGDPPDLVGALLDDWIDSDLDAGAWPFSANDQDAIAALKAALANQGDEVVIPDDGVTSTDAFTIEVYRLIGEGELPAGCFTTNTIGLLVPVSQTTTANVTFVRFDATLAQDAPTATPTGTPTPTATSTAESTPEATESPEATAEPTGESEPDKTPTPAGQPVTQLPVTGAVTTAPGNRMALNLLLIFLAVCSGRLSLAMRRRPKN